MLDSRVANNNLMPHLEPNDGAIADAKHADDGHKILLAQMASLK